MSKKRILICGATGFIGRNLCEYFEGEGAFDVTGTFYHSNPFDGSQIKWVQADLTRPEDVERVIRGADIIIQAAAVTSGSGDVVTRPHIHTTDNAVMNSLIFRAAYEHKVSQVVFFSCSVMYPSSAQPLKETDFHADQEMNPKYFGAGWTKVYLEKMCEFYSRQGKTRYTAIRHTNIYGPYDKFDLKRSHVFGATMTKVMSSQNGKILVWGDGSEKRDLLYISDLVRFVKMALNRQDSAFSLCNVGCGKVISVADLVKKIIIASGKDLIIEYDRSKPSIKTSLALDCSKAKTLFRWEPEISLDEGIKKTMNWYRSSLKVN